MQHVHEFTERVSRWLAWLAGGIILFGCALPISIDVITRAVIGRTVVESFEISGYAFAACIGLGMGYTVTSKANIRVDILIARLPQKFRIPIDFVASISLALTAVAFAYYTFDVLQESIKLDARSQSTLQIPLIIPQSIWWLGFVWFATVACLIPLFAALRLLSRDTKGAEALISNPDLSDEMKEIGFDVEGDES